MKHEIPTERPADAETSLHAAHATSKESSPEEPEIGDLEDNDDFVVIDKADAELPIEAVSEVTQPLPAPLVDLPVDVVQDAAQDVFSSDTASTRVETYAPETAKSVGNTPVNVAEDSSAIVEPALSLQHEATGLSTVDARSAVDEIEIENKTPAGILETQEAEPRASSGVRIDDSVETPAHDGVAKLISGVSPEETLVLSEKPIELETGTPEVPQVSGDPDDMQSVIPDAALSEKQVSGQDQPVEDKPEESHSAPLDFTAAESEAPDSEVPGISAEDPKDSILVDSPAEKALQQDHVLSATTEQLKTKVETPVPELALPSDAADKPFHDELPHDEAHKSAAEVVPADISNQAGTSATSQGKPEAEQHAVATDVISDTEAQVPVDKLEDTPADAATKALGAPEVPEPSEHTETASREMQPPRVDEVFVVASEPAVEPSDTEAPESKPTSEDTTAPPAAPAEERASIADDKALTTSKGSPRTVDDDTDDHTGVIAAGIAGAAILAAGSAVVARKAESSEKPDSTLDDKQVLASEKDISSKPTSAAVSTILPTEVPPSQPEIGREAPPQSGPLGKGPQEADDLVTAVVKDHIAPTRALDFASRDVPDTLAPSPLVTHETPKSQFKDEVHVPRSSIRTGGGSIPAKSSRRTLRPPLAHSSTQTDDDGSFVFPPNVYPGFLNSVDFEPRAATPGVVLPDPFDTNAKALGRVRSLRRQHRRTVRRTEETIAAAVVLYAASQELSSAPNKSLGSSQVGKAIAEALEPVQEPVHESQSLVSSGVAGDRSVDKSVPVPVADLSTDDEGKRSSDSSRSDRHHRHRHHHHRHHSDRSKEDRSSGEHHHRHHHSHHRRSRTDSSASGKSASDHSSSRTSKREDSGISAAESGHSSSSRRHRTPEEQAAHDKRKEERRAARDAREKERERESKGKGPETPPSDKHSSHRSSRRHSQSHTERPASKDERPTSKGEASSSNRKSFFNMKNAESVMAPSPSQRPKPAEAAPAPAKDEAAKPSALKRSSTHKSHRKSVDLPRSKSHRTRDESPKRRRRDSKVEPESEEAKAASPSTSSPKEAAAGKDEEPREREERKDEHKRSHLRREDRQKAREAEAKKKSSSGIKGVFKKLFT
ncbi:hypothetical protein F4778DRAFT_723606 [Xylariomycetidae sp. FL2044]|nr:hypothetical protein F4778DRAFT_723606 [Xylariomycetidae sp. FL2044]